MTNVLLRTGIVPAASFEIHQSSAALQPVVSLPHLMNQRELATYLGKSVAWCERARWSGDGPKFVKLGRNVRYRAEDVLAWVNEKLHTSTAMGVTP